MPHRELLTESQRLSLQTPASDERGRVRHYTLSSEDLLGLTKSLLSIGMEQQVTRPFSGGASSEGSSTRSKCQLNWSNRSTGMRRCRF